MKKLYFLSWAFILIGLLILVISGIWFYKYPNPSEYFPYFGGGIIAFIFAGFVEALKKVIDRQEYLEKNQVELQRWATEQEKKNNSNE